MTNLYPYNPINKTSLVFNEKLKTNIKKLRQEYSSIIRDLTTSYKHTDPDRPDQVIRCMFDTLFNEFDYDGVRKKAFKNPDYFALFMCLININIDQLSCWEEVMKSVGEVGLGYNGIKHTCCCGKVIEHSCFIQSELPCIVGNCCVEKNLITNDLLADKFKLIKKQQKAETKLKKDEEFKINNPGLCPVCRVNKCGNWPTCHPCKIVIEKLIKCGCGKYFESKYPRCWTCNQKVRN